MYPSPFTLSKENRNTDAQPCLTVAPDTLHICAKLQPCSHTQLKATLIPRNSSGYPVPGLKCTPDHYCFG